MSKKIMIVDDDRGILEAMQTLYDSEGYEVIIDQENGNRLYQKLIDRDPDLLVLDVFLSNGDGRNIARNIKEMGLISDIPILMVSAREDVKESVMECGACGFLSKPFDISELLEKSREYLR